MYQSYLLMRLKQSNSVKNTNYPVMMLLNLYEHKQAGIPKILIIAKVEIISLFN